MERDLNILVIGAGIGGLATALSLHHEGFRVRVLERAKMLSEVGAGVLITPNSIRLLESVGLGDELSRIGAPIGDDAYYYRHTGEKAAPYQTSDSTGERQALGVHRADLIRIFEKALPDGIVRTNTLCVDIEQTSSGAIVHTENGETYTADVVIGADGIHAKTRRYVAGEAEPRFSGYVAYRGLVPSDTVQTMPSTLSLWMGEGKHFLVYPVRGGKLLNYVAFVPEEHKTKESWVSPGDPRQLANEFRGWDPRVESLLSQVEETYKWGLYDRDPLRKWVEGNLALLGDAAHPMLPHLGQGANQSIEDAFALATILSKRNDSSLAEALTLYAVLRQERTEKVQLGSRTNRKRYNSLDGDLEQRDRDLQQSQAFRFWIFDYDAIREAETMMQAPART